eukprot:SAG11_NODE_17267_length_523_cov_1.313679_1_plen_89_part_10
MALDGNECHCAPMCGAASGLRPRNDETEAKLAGLQCRRGACSSGSAAATERSQSCAATAPGLGLQAGRSTQAVLRQRASPSAKPAGRLG